jgi:hypothetical protein
MIWWAWKSNFAGRPHEPLDAWRRSVDTIANNSTSPLDVERKNDELLMVCLEYKCDKFQPNGTCFCCEVNFTNGCFLTHHECVWLTADIARGPIVLRSFSILDANAGYAKISPDRSQIKYVRWHVSCNFAINKLHFHYFLLKYK